MQKHIAEQDSKDSVEQVSKAETISVSSFLEVRQKYLNLKHQNHKNIFDRGEGDFVTTFGVNNTQIYRS